LLQTTCGQGNSSLDCVSSLITKFPLICKGVFDEAPLPSASSGEVLNREKSRVGKADRISGRPGPAPSSWPVVQSPRQLQRSRVQSCFPLRK